MIADFVGPFPPYRATEWQTWLKLPDRKVMVKLPSGEWRLKLDLTHKRGTGISMEAGGVAAGRIDGAHGHLPAWLANALVSLKRDNSEVVTEDKMANEAKRIVTLFTPTKQVVEGGKLGKSTKGFIAVREGLCAFRADNQLVTVTDDVLPVFEDGIRATWEQTLFIATPLLAAVCPVVLPSSGAGRFKVFTGADPQTPLGNRNLGYPSGIWLNRTTVDGIAPVYRAVNAEESGHANALLAHYVCMGVR